MEFRQTESGLFVPKEEPPQENPPEALPVYKCAGCGKESADAISSCSVLIGYRTSDAFCIERPRCDHGEFALCPDCDRDKAKWKCPVCGCGEFYC
jgi:hypothetical protein